VIKTNKQTNLKNNEGIRIARDSVQKVTKYNTSFTHDHLNGLLHIPVPENDSLSL